MKDLGHRLPNFARKALVLSVLAGKRAGAETESEKERYKKAMGQAIKRKAPVPKLEEGAVKNFIKGFVNTLGPTPQSDRAGEDPNQYVKPYKRKAMKKEEYEKEKAEDILPDSECKKMKVDKKDLHKRMRKLAKKEVEKHEKSGLHEARHGRSLKTSINILRGSKRKPDKNAKSDRDVKGDLEKEVGAAIDKEDDPKYMRESVSRRKNIKKIAAKQRQKYAQKRGELPPIMGTRGRYNITRKETSSLKGIVAKQAKNRKTAKEILKKAKSNPYEQPTSPNVTALVPSMKKPRPSEIVLKAVTVTPKPMDFDSMLSHYRVTGHGYEELVDAAEKLRSQDKRDSAIGHRMGKHDDSGAQRFTDSRWVEKRHKERMTDINRAKELRNPTSNKSIGQRMKDKIRKMFSEDCGIETKDNKEMWKSDKAKKLIDKALKATRGSSISKFATGISDNPKPGDRLCNGEKLHEVLEAVKRRLDETA